MAGGLYRRNNSKVWWGRVKHAGRKHCRSLGTANKREAEQRLQEWIDDLKGTQWGTKVTHIFDEMAERFIEEHFKCIAEKSAIRYGVSVVNLAKYFAGKPVDEISRSDLMAFEMARRDEGVSTSTIRRDLTCLSVMYALAYEWEWPVTNPVQEFMKRRARKGLKEGDARIRYLDHPEEDKLLAASKDHLMLHAAITLAIDTGLRKFEQLPLEWKQISTKKEQVTVVGKGGKVRTVPLLPRTLEMLARLPRALRSPLVFWHHDGKPYFDLYPQLQKAAKKAGLVEHLEWHDLRRTCGCRLIQDHRLTMPEVSLWLGHSSVQVTEECYAFLKVDSLHRAIADAAALARSVKNAGIQKEYNNNGQESADVVFLPMKR